MQDSKEITWGGDFNGDNNGADDRTEDGTEQGVAANDAENTTSGKSDPDGWQQYRRWISKAPAPRGKRNGIDPSLYTWKGYRTWTEQVKRNWSDN